MRGWLGFIMICVAAVSMLSQTSSNYQPGTVTAVTAHESLGQQESDIHRYDVSVEVGNTRYVVLFTPPKHTEDVMFHAGNDVLVQVGASTLTFDGPVSGKTEIPILRRETLPAPRLDWSQACRGYFSKKLEHLSGILGLTDSQQAHVKPILEQETGEVGQICFNPVLSREQKLNRYKKIVQASDNKIKPLLSVTQLQKLEDLRREQKRELKEILAKQKS